MKPIKATFRIGVRRRWDAETQRAWFWWVMKSAGNHKILGNSEQYTTKRAAWDTAEIVAAGRVEVEDWTGQGKVKRISA